MTDTAWAWVWTLCLLSILPFVYLASRLWYRGRYQETKKFAKESLNEYTHEKE